MTLRTALSATLLIVASVLVANVPLHGQTFITLYSFNVTGKGGKNPYSGVLLGADGTVFGTTDHGGTGTCADGESGGCGTLYSVSASGTETVLYNFQLKPDANYPSGTLIEDSSGNFYGTTEFGGSYNEGAVFEVTSSGTEGILHSFSGSDGEDPIGIARDQAGNLYGVTQVGGPKGFGTVFKLSPSGTLTELHTFSGPDGAEPYGGVIVDPSGNVYGTTTKGGDTSGCHHPSGCGTVFKINTAGRYKVLHAFSGPPDGAFVFAGLVRDSSGNLYGVTTAGGASDYGTLFKIDSADNESILHSFIPSDGEAPNTTPALDSSGNLYGSTSYGGSDTFGTVYEVSSDGTLTVLHNFTFSIDGLEPNAVIVDGNRNVYGTTPFGGTENAGAVFEITP
jgi:uncharacterized repeat protein (TIGR03803 family)